MKIFFAGVFHHFSNWLLNLRAASCDASSKMKTFVGNNFQLSLSQHDFSLWWIEDLLLGVFSDMEDWKGQILWILKKIKFSIEYDDKWIALLLGFEINSMIHFMKWTIHLHVLAGRFYPYMNILLCFVFQDQCIIYLRCIYHIYFAEEKKWTSLFILLFCGLHAFNQVAFRHIQWSQWNWELFTKNWIRWFSWRGDCALSYFHESGKAKTLSSGHISLFFFVLFKSY